LYAKLGIGNVEVYPCDGCKFFICQDCRDTAEGVKGEYCYLCRAYFHERKYYSGEGEDEETKREYKRDLRKSVKELKKRKAISKAYEEYSKAYFKTHQEFRNLKKIKSVKDVR